MHSLPIAFIELVSGLGQVNLNFSMPHFLTESYGKEYLTKTAVLQRCMHVLNFTHGE